MKDKMQKQFYKKRKFWIIVIVAAILVGGIYFYIQRRNKNGLETATISRGTVTETLILTGEVKAEEHAMMAFPLSGTLDEVYVTEGESVVKNQRLARLDATALYAQLKQAEYNLRSATATVERVYDEVKGNDDDESYTQRETRTTAEVARDNAYQSMVIASHNLRNSILYAPFDGIVTNVASPEGVSTLATQMQIEVINPNTVYFQVYADQTEIGQIDIGTEVEIILDSFLDTPLKATVTYISFSPDPTQVGVVYSIKAALDTSELSKINYKVGMTGDSIFILDQKENVLNVPFTFINSDNDGDYVLINKKEKVYVEVGLEGEDNVEISSPDLSEGMVVYD